MEYARVSVTHMLICAVIIWCVQKTTIKRFRRKPKAGSVWDASSSRMSITSSQAQSDRSNTEEGEGSESEQDPPEDVTVGNEFRLETSLGTNIWTLDDTNRSCMVCENFLYYFRQNVKCISLEAEC